MITTKVYSSQNIPCCSYETFAVYIYLVLPLYCSFQMYQVSFVNKISTLSKKQKDVSDYIKLYSHSYDM